MTLHRTAFRLALIAVLSQPLAALAGGTVQVLNGQGEDAIKTTMEFEGEQLRITPEVSADAKNYMVFRDGKPYMVSGEGDAPMVMEMTAMARMAGGMMKNMEMGGSTFDDVAVYHGLKATGRSEVHAGITGEVYLLEYTTKKGQRVSEEMVLAKHPVLKDMNRATAKFGLVMAEAMGVADAQGAKQIEAEFNRLNVGMLRYGQDYKVVSVSNRSPAASRFVLPAAPTEMPDFGGLMGGAAAGGNAQAGGGLGAIFGGKVERQQERIESRTEGEADAATDRAVDKVLDKAFGKIFGGQ